MIKTLSFETCSENTNRSKTKVNKAANNNKYKSFYLVPQVLTFIS